MTACRAYIFSGLGADKRAFARIKFPEHLEPVFLEWLEPLEKEDFEAYCERLSAQVKTDLPYVFIGLSFGGITAVELSRKLNPEKIIIISSAATCRELPRIYTILGALQFHRFIPAPMLMRANRFSYYLFGVNEPEDKLLLKQILADTSPVFLKWAINCILNWNNEQRPANLVHIHGTADKIIYCRNTAADFQITGGGHFMVYTHAAEVNKALGDIIGVIS